MNSVILNQKECKLLKERISFHSWKDMLAVYNSWERIGEKFKMSVEEIKVFRSKLDL